MMRLCVLLALLLGSLPASVHAQAPPEPTIETVNRKLVKLFGSGGFQRLASYGTGIVVSPQGHILTAASQMLDTQDLRVHLADGRRMRATVLVIEPALDAALVKLKIDENHPIELAHYFDIRKEAARPLAEAGDSVLAFSNQFQIATRHEPLSVMHGVIAARARLFGRIGVSEAPYSGEVYFIDAITNNPGAAGGALTNRRGELLGMLGKELKNTLTETWINYAVPLQSKVEIKRGDKTESVSLADFVEQGIQGTYKPSQKENRTASGPGGYHGIVFVPNVVPLTPPYIETVEANSPAAKAGLRADDLIVFADGDPILSIQAFKDIVAKTRPGVVLKLEVRRGGSDRLETVDLKLEDFPKKAMP